MLAPSSAARTISGNYTLSADEDWTADGAVILSGGPKIDLAGHSLTVAGFAIPSNLAITNAEGVVSGYADLAHLETSGRGGSGQRILTDFKPQDADVVEMCVRFHSDNFDQNQILWCSRTNGTSVTFTGAKIGSKARFDRRSKTSGADTYTLVSGTDYTLVADYGTCACTVNGEAAGTMADPASFTPPTNLVLFASFKISSGRMSDWGNHADVRFYYCKIWRSGSLAAWFLPAYETGSGTIGVYDRVAGKFYTNAGSGDFTAETADDPEITNSASGDPAELHLAIPAYKELEYIQAGGSQAILTDYLPASTDRIEIKFEPEHFTDNQFYFCTRTKSATGGTGDQFCLAALPTRIRFDHGGYQVKSSLYTSSGKTCALVANGATGKLTDADGGTEYGSLTVSSFTAPTNLVLFASFTISSGKMSDYANYAYCKCYYVKAYGSDDTLKLDMVPACDPATGAYGMFDKVGEKFYPSSTATAFSGHGDETGTLALAYTNDSIVVSGNLKVVK